LALLVLPSFGVGWMGLGVRVVGRDGRFIGRSIVECSDGGGDGGEDGGCAYFVKGQGEGSEPGLWVGVLAEGWIGWRSIRFGSRLPCSEISALIFGLGWFGIVSSHLVMHALSSCNCLLAHIPSSKKNHRALCIASHHPYYCRQAGSHRCHRHRHCAWMDRARLAWFLPFGLCWLFFFPLLNLRLVLW
jgi:hypothetical protein